MRSWRPHRVKGALGGLLRSSRGDPRLKKILDRRLMRALPPIPVGLALVFTLVFFLNLFYEPTRPVPIALLVTNALTVIGFVVLAWVLSRWKIASRYAHPLALVIFLLLLMDVLVAAASTAQSLNFIYLSIIIVGFGAIMLSLPWLLATIGLTLASSAVVASTVLDPVDLRYYGVSLFAATLISVILVRSRARELYRREEALAAALDEAAKRRRIEASLLESETRLELAIAGSQGGWWDLKLDPDKPDSLPDDIDLDPTVKSFIGYEDHEFPNSLRAWRERILAEDRESYLAALEEHLAGSTPLFESEYRVRHRSGETRWIQSRGRIVRDDAGRPIRWSGLDWDITDSMRNRERLKLLTRAVEQSPSLVIITDKDGKIEYVNPKFVRSTGYSPREVIGHKPSFLKSEANPPEFYRQLWKTIASGGEWHGEFKNRRKDGTDYWVISSISPIKDATGKTRHYLAVQEDVTERKRVEARLAQSQRLESVGQLVSGVAHDFNNLLTAVIGFADLGLSRLNGDERLHHDLVEIKKAGESAGELTRQLLAFSRQQVLEPRVIVLNQVVGDMEELLRRTIDEDIELELSLADDLGVTRVDPVQLRQILVNLAVNARDAMPQGGRLTVATRNIDLDGHLDFGTADPVNGAFVSMAVTDTGTGMDELTRERACEPFFTTKSRAHGTGLGLATVYGAVKQSGGYLTLDSEPGIGTCCTIYLPRVADAVEPEVSGVVSDSRGGDESILVVEDDPGVRRVVSRALEKAGYRVCSCGDAEEAIDAFARNDVDLLLTDMIMPGTNGLGLARELLSRKPALRVLLMSGYTGRSIHDPDGLLPSIPFLQKPFQLEDLLAKVGSCLSP